MKSDKGSGEQEFFLTVHARRRSRSRGIKVGDAAVCIKYSKDRHLSGGCVVYTLRREDLHGTPFAVIARRLHGLRVVVDPATGAVVTCCWRPWAAAYGQCFTDSHAIN